MEGSDIQHHDPLRTKKLQIINSFTSKSFKTDITPKRKESQWPSHLSRMITKFIAKLDDILIFEVSFAEAFKT